MKYISLTEFMTHQQKYFDIAETETIVLTSSLRKPMVISPLDESFLSEEEWECVKKGMDEINKGHSIKINSEKELCQYLEGNDL